MKLQFSAGGVVYKKRGNKEKILKQVQDDIKILVCQHSQHHGWVFPKGLIGDNIGEETKEETALREVKEETGVDAKIVRPLTPVTYWFKLNNEIIKKTVYYFLMEFVAGHIKKHDKEMESVEFLPIDKIEGRLTYKSDKKVWREARKLI